MTDNQVLQAYEQRFGAATPPLDYGHQCYTLDELAALAAEALATGEPIPWEDLLAPLPAGALS